MLPALAAPLLLAAPLAPRPAPATSFQDVGLYQTFDATVDWAGSFAASNPDLVELVEYGRSYEDRPLLALKLGDQPGLNDPDRPEFLFTAGIHAREVISSESAWRLAERLVEGYRSGDPAVLDVFAEREVWIVPTMNPDGRRWFEDGRSDHRKNTHHYAGQLAGTYQQGVDLNRNFPYRWSASLSIRSREDYRGPAPLSEPEASALWDLLHDDAWFNDLLGAIDFHSGAATILRPDRHPADPPVPETQRAKLIELQQQMGIRSGLSTAPLWYTPYGTVHSSLYDEFGTHAFTVELYADASAWGSPPDYFAFFNPTDQAGLDAAVDAAVASAEFLLSDDAFAIAVPEPSACAYGAAALLGLAWWVRRRRPPAVRTWR